ncbi:hypothetical protein FOA43_002375 [Brettanomyces nanus]|uniref:SGTA homodimerisation domain-containing protein n=1 Tax=Eeniella nana TaxID=13502 RepID=A0A875S3T7_EENNA|nr:uncharacterized protein FOA43_002375 [Brettanomyces nanus]QPG75035.1 hypothetical protein FOA43_002375 [Brettanomyces nanus]
MLITTERILKSSKAIIADFINRKDNRFNVLIEKHKAFVLVTCFNIKCTNKEIASLVIKFLSESLSKGDVPADNKDSLEFAIESIGEAYGVEKGDVDNILGDKFDKKGLSELIESALATKSHSNTEKSTTGRTNAPSSSSNGREKVSEETKQRAEAHKLEGNKAMARRDFEEAISNYTKAIELDSTNAVYLSNRAAAYSSIRSHELALEDAKKAIEVNPDYAKAWSRMGLAKYAMGDAQGAMEAYEQGMKVEGDKHSPAMQKGFETAKKRVTEKMASGLGSVDEPKGTSASSSDSATATDAGSAANPLAGLGGLGGLLNNPQVMQAAQKMMQNPDALKNLMNNPQLRQMAQSMGLGGDAAGTAGATSAAGSTDSADATGATNATGTPSLNDLMNNPMLRNLANQFMNNKGNQDQQQ